LILELLENKMQLSYSQLTSKTLFSVITISKLELKLIVTIFMESDNVSSKVSGRKMENGVSSIEIEDNVLIEELDFKLMVIILSIY
jgi:hypothetical protein